jgi:hypothetical protein
VDRDLEDKVALDSVFERVSETFGQTVVVDGGASLLA